MSRSSIAIFGQSELVNPFSLQREDLKLEAISHSLSQLNRYTGHCLFPYSVAQHTCLLIDAVPAKIKRATAAHDWSESFFNDLANPVKRQLPEYMRMENILQERIFELIDEPIENLHACHEYDRRICVDEMIALFPHFDKEWISYAPLGVKIEEWDWRRAKTELLTRLEEII